MPSLESKAYDYLEKRFGVRKEDIEGLDLMERNGDVWLASETSSDFKAETIGIRAIRNMDTGLKPTTYLLQYIAPFIDKNIVELEKEEFIKLLNREDMVERHMSDEGYVALQFEDRIFGCGFYMNEKVSSRVPKGRAEELVDIIISAT